MVPAFFAPDVDICEVIDHYTKEPDSSCSQRNALIESARLARSCIQPLCECEACNFSALIIPGGFGAVRTLLVIFVSTLFRRCRISLIFYRHFLIIEATLLPKVANVQ